MRGISKSFCYHSRNGSEKFRVPSLLFLGVSSRQVTKRRDYSLPLLSMHRRTIESLSRSKIVRVIVINCLYASVVLCECHERAAAKEQARRKIAQNGIVQQRSNYGVSI